MARTGTLVPRDPTPRIRRFVHDLVARFPDAADLPPGEDVRTFVAETASVHGLVAFDLDAGVLLAP